MAVKAKRGKWNPSHHPRDARGRFTRSSTRVMKPEDRKRAAAGQAGFAPADLKDAGARAEWLQRASASTPSAEGGAIGRYLAGGWRETNPALRQGKAVEGVDQLDAAFTPLDEDVMLRRVVPAAMFAHIPVDQLVGMKVRDAAPASASLDHTGPGHSGAVTMHIATPAGTRAYINDDAGEVLLMRDTEVAITRAVPREDGNGWDLFGVLIPRKDTPARPAKAARKDDDQGPAVVGPGEPEQPPAGAEGDETTDGSGGNGEGGGTTAPAAAPVAADPPLVLWKDAETGRPVYSPAQPEIVRGQVVRDPEREERVRRGMAIAAAAMAGEPETPADTDQAPAGDLDASDAPDTDAPETPAADSDAPQSPVVSDGVPTTAPEAPETQAAGDSTDEPAGLAPDKLAEPGELPNDATTLAEVLARLPIMEDTREQVRAYLLSRAGRFVDAKSGITAEPSKINFDGGEIGYWFALRNAAGERVGSAKRTIGRNRVTGVPYVTNQHIEIDDETLRGGGFAARFNARNEAFWHANGIDQMHLTANTDVGGYAWARAGYDFEDVFAAHDIGDHLDALLRGERRDGSLADGSVAQTYTADGWDDATRTAAADLVARSRAAMAEYDRRVASSGLVFDADASAAAVELAPTPLEFAMLGWTPDSGSGKAAMWPGKQFLLGRQWNGQKRLDVTPEDDTDTPAAGTDAPATPDVQSHVTRDPANRGRIAAATAAIRDYNPPAAPEARPASAPAAGTVTGTATPDAGTTTDVADLAAAVASGETAVQPITGGANSKVELVTYADGTVAVRKTPVPNENDPTPAKQQADAEELASQVYLALGANVPRVLRTGEDQVVQDYMPGSPGADLNADDRLPYVETDGGRLLGLGDLLIANDDRHTRNWQIDDQGNLIGIDHALAFNFNTKIVDGRSVPEEADGAPTFPGGLFAVPLLVPYGERRRTGSDGWADHDFTPADMAVVRERLAALQPRFAELGRDDWHTMMMARLDGLAPQATGTRNRIAGDDQAPAAGTAAPAAPDASETVPATDTPAAPAAGGPRIPEPEGVRISGREDPAGWAAARTDAELADTAAKRGVLPRIRKAIAEEQRLRAMTPEEFAAEQRLNAAVSNPTRGKWAELGLTSGDRVIFFGDKVKAKDRGEVATVTLSNGRRPSILVEGEGDSSSLLMRLDSVSDRFWVAPVDAPSAPDSDQQDQVDTPATPAAPDAAVDARDADPPATPGSDRALGELAVANIQTHTDDDFAALDATADIERGDLVVVKSFNRWRTAVVLSVSARGKVEAVVATPSSPDRVYGARGRAGTDVKLLRKGSRPATPVVDDDQGIPVAALDDPATSAPEAPAADSPTPDAPEPAPEPAPSPAAPAATEPRPAAPDGPPLDADRDLADQAQRAAGIARSVGLPRRTARMGDPAYKRDYNRGYEAARRGSGAIERADDRQERSGWYDGYSDYAIDAPKWSTPKEADADDRGLFAGEPFYRVTSYTVNPDTGERTENPRPESFSGRERLALFLKGYAQVDLDQDRISLDGPGEATSRNGRTAYTWTPTPQDQAKALPVTEEDLIRRYLDANPDARPAGYQATPAADTSAPTIDQRVVSAITGLLAGDGSEPGALLSLARLRDELSDVPRADLDAELKRLNRERVIQLDPDPDRRNLTARARAAAIPLGGEDLHLVSLVQPSSSDDDLDGPPTPSVATPAPAVDIDAVRADDMVQVAGEWVLVTKVRKAAGTLPTMVQIRRRDGSTEWVEAPDLEGYDRRPDPQAPAAGAGVPAARDADDPFAAMTTAVPRTVRPSETAAGTAAGAYETDMFGNVTTFTPADRSTIGVGARAQVGRERGMAAVQQLGMFDVPDQQQMDGQGALLGSLFDMPQADAPPTTTPPTTTPPPADTDPRDALAGRVLAEDLSGWSDEQLAGALVDITAGDTLTADHEAALERINDEWAAREADMRSTATAVPDDLTALPEDDVVALLVNLTSADGTIDEATVRRVNDELNRRETEAAAANATAGKRALADRDPATMTSDADFEAASAAATDLADWDAFERIMGAWSAFEDDRNARAEAERLEAARVEAERLEAARVAAEAAAQRELAAAVEAERVRTEDVMIAARLAAVIPPTDDAAVRSAHAVLGEDGTRRALGPEKYDRIAAAADNGPLQTPDARVYGIRAALLSLDEQDKTRLVMAAAEADTPADLRGMSDLDLLMEHFNVDSPADDETPEQADTRIARDRAIRAEQGRRGMVRIRDEGVEAFGRYREKLRTSPVGDLTDVEVGAAAATLAGDPDSDLLAKLDEIRAESARRQAEATTRATRKAAGPQRPAKLANPMGALAALERGTEGYRDTPYGREAGGRLLEARALTVGLPMTATDQEIRKAEKADDRSGYERAAWTIAWYRHLGEFATIDDTYRRVDWVTGPDDDPDVPDVPMPLPGAKVAKPVDVWEAMKQQAIYDRRAGINDGAQRYTMALARSYGIPFDPADRSDDAMKRLGSLTWDAQRADTRTQAQRTASYIAEWRRLAAEDGVDPANHLLYGPPDKRPRSLPRTQWAPTADEEIRTNRLVAGGMDWDQAFAQVMGIDLDDLRREQAASAVTGTARPTDKIIRQHYQEHVTRQYLDAEAATRGFLLNKLGEAKGVDPESLFSGDPDRAYRFASEELMRWWADNPRLTFAEYKAQLVGQGRAAREQNAQSGKGNEFA